MRKVEFGIRGMLIVREFQLSRQRYIIVRHEKMLLNLQNFEPEIIEFQFSMKEVVFYAQDVELPMGAVEFLIQKLIYLERLNLI